MITAIAEGEALKINQNARRLQTALTAVHNMPRMSALYLHRRPKTQKTMKTGIFGKYVPKIA
jgi:hypothetical protein